MSAGSARNGGSRPPGLVALAAITGVEALAAAVIGVLALVASPLGDTSGVTSGIAVAAFVLVFAVLLALVAVGLLRRQPWTRSASLVWQLIQALVGAYSLQGGAGAAVPFGLATVGLAVAALVLLFTRPVREAIERA